MTSNPSISDVFLINVALIVQHVYTLLVWFENGCRLPKPILRCGYPSASSALLAIGWMDSNPVLPGKHRWFRSGIWLVFVVWFCGSARIGINHWVCCASDSSHSIWNLGLFCFWCRNYCAPKAGIVNQVDFKFYLLEYEAKLWDFCMKFYDFCWNCAFLRTTIGPSRSQSCHCGP